MTQSPLPLSPLKHTRLKRRAAFVSAIRSFFEQRDFIEIQTPLLVSNPGLEPHLEHFSTELTPGMGINSKKRLYLPTSPEYHLKKALSCGLERVFELTRGFRNGELGAKHQPEFSILEWYRAPGTYQEIAKDFEQLCQSLSTFSDVDPLWAKSEHLSVSEAFERYAGLDLNAVLSQSLNLASVARLKGLGFVDERDSFSTAFNKIIVEKIEPRLGFHGVCYLWDYPASEAALSRKKPDSPYYCERFEVYWKGVELANAFGELTDSVEQRARCLADQKHRIALYGESPPLDEEFLVALDSITSAGGIAVGVDRLIMCLMGLTRIEDIIAFPHEN